MPKIMVPLRFIFQLRKIYFISSIAQCETQQPPIFEPSPEIVYNPDTVAMHIQWKYFDSYAGFG